MSLFRHRARVSSQLIFRSHISSQRNAVARRSGVLGCSNDPKFSVEQVDAVEADALLLQFPAADKGPFALHGIEHSVITELPLGLRTYQAIAVTPLDVPKPNGRIWLTVALPD